MDELFKTGDNRMDFVLENYMKVVDFEECLKHTKDNFSNSLLKRLKKLLDEWGFENLEIAKDRNAEWVSWEEPRFYSEANDCGLYYAIQIDNGWDTLAGRGDYPVHLGLWRQKAQGRGEGARKINIWIDNSERIVGANKDKLARNGISVVTNNPDFDGICIAVVYLEKELSLASLSTIPFRDIAIQLRDKVKLFVEILTGERGLIKPFFK
jgi:hypothetical protein